jgi:hypothetical protein
MNNYLPAEENKTFLLHCLVYLTTFLAGLQQIMSNICDKCDFYLIGNGRKFIDDASRFV